MVNNIKYILLFFSCASSPCYTWSISSIMALCSRGGGVHTEAPFAASLLDQIHMLLPHWLTPLSALNQNPATVSLPGLLTRVHHLLPLTAAWVAVITVCGSNMQSSCWHTTTTEATGRSPLLRRTSSMRTLKLTWRWRSDSWKRRDWCIYCQKLPPQCWRGISVMISLM